MNSETIQIYDPPLCCSTGVCGPDVDPELIRIAALVEKWKAENRTVERYNLGQEPIAFVRNPEVKALLDEKGVDSLPLVFVGGRLVSEGAYPASDSLDTKS